MPTGYTHKVQDGEITELRDYAYNCAYAFGAMIAYRDDNEQDKQTLPKKLKGCSSSYYVDSLSKARQEFAEWRKKTPNARKHMFERHKKKELANLAKYIEKKGIEAKRYDSMIAKVEAWNPDNKMIPLRNFMLQQLEESKKFDCSSDYYETKKLKWHRMTYEEWEQNHLQGIKRRIEYAVSELSKEKTRQKERQDWVDCLRAEFEGETKPT